MNRWKRQGQVFTVLAFVAILETGRALPKASGFDGLGPFLMLFASLVLLPVIVYAFYTYG